MAKIDFLNLKKFNDYIVIDESVASIYDKKIKAISKRIVAIKEEMKLYENLVSLSDEEMKNAKGEADYRVLVKDKEYFINMYIKYKSMNGLFCRDLNRLYYKKNKLNELVSSINYYNTKFDIINEIVNQYNYDFLCNEKSNIDINKITEFKTNIHNIIDFGRRYNGINIDIDRLESEYKFLLDIEEYYNSSYKENSKKTDELSKNNSLDIFEVKSCDEVVDDNSNQSMPRDFGYINYCSELRGKNRIKSKVKKIRKSSKWNKIKKSLKKNIKKVIAGLLVGVTMLGASTITAGFDLNNNNDSNTKVVSTVESVSSNDVVSKIEDTTGNSKTVEKTQQQSINHDMQNDNAEEAKEQISTVSVEEKITIGTSVSASSDIYINATDAYNKENSMTPYYPISKEREVCLIYYKNNDGDTVLISEDNKDKIDKLNQLKYDVVAYCLDDGWYNKDDIKVLAK